MPAFQADRLQGCHRTISHWRWLCSSYMHMFALCMPIRPVTFIVCRSATHRLTFDAVSFTMTIAIPLDFPEQKPTIVLQVCVQFVLQLRAQKGWSRSWHSAVWQAHALHAMMPYESYLPCSACCSQASAHMLLLWYHHASHNIIVVKIESCQQIAFMTKKYKGSN